MADYRNADPTNPLPRGLRNNNPGNIKMGDNWQGAVGNDGTFLIFADTIWGLRAIARSLTNMIGKGLVTIQQLISTWSATDQQAYINNVSAATGIPASQMITADPATLHGIIRGIVNQENGDVYGDTYISDADIDQGISMAAGGLSTLPQAALVYAEANPAAALMIAATAAITLYYLFGDNEKPVYE